MHVRRSLAALGALTALSLSACSSGIADTSTEGTTGSGGRGEASISGLRSTEGTVIASMYEQVLAAAGWKPTVSLVATREDYLPSFPGSIDVAPEQVGDLVGYLDRLENGPAALPVTSDDAGQVISQGASLLDDAGIDLLPPSEASDTTAFFVTRAYARRHALSTLSDLRGRSVVLAATRDCAGRLACAGGLADPYGVDVTKILPLGRSTQQTYRAVLDGRAQLGETTSTDGTLAARGLVALDDDRQVQPAQNLVPAVSATFLADNSEIADTLDPLMSALSTDALQRLDRRVTEGAQSPREVAHAFLVRQGLL